MKKLRKKKGITQAALAEMIGVSLRQLGGWERQEAPFPLDKACLVADFFECTLDELAGRTPPVLHEYSDPRQQLLNQTYLCLDDIGKTKATELVEDISYRYRAVR
jgi:transcriptional regulator with XRE-family HTH domain